MAIEKPVTKSFCHSSCSSCFFDTISSNNITDHGFCEATVSSMLIGGSSAEIQSILHAVYLSCGENVWSQVDQLAACKESSALTTSRNYIHGENELSTAKSMSSFYNSPTSSSLKHCVIVLCHLSEIKQQSAADCRHARPIRGFYSLCNHAWGLDIPILHSRGY